MSETLLSEDGFEAAPRLSHVLTVAEWQDGQARLTGARASACSACAAKTGCATGAINEAMGGETHLTLPYAKPLTPGDQVVVSLPSKAFLSVALRAYLLPPLSLAFAALVASLLGLSDLGTALLCLPFLGLGFLPLLRAEKRAAGLSELRIDGPASAGSAP
ncbi:MAG: SoxR reducing system RseC family protein [Mangrovicoccus sp.]